jgi:cellobiose-specific phosphotransferase system component IIC
MEEKTRVEIELKLAQAQLATAEALLAVKKARWYELVIFGGAGITLGLVIAQAFLH